MAKSSKIDKNGYLHMNFGVVLLKLNKSKIAVFGDEFIKTLFFFYLLWQVTFKFEIQFKNWDTIYQIIE